MCKRSHKIQFSQPSRNFSNQRQQNFCSVSGSKEKSTQFSINKKYPQKLLLRKKNAILTSLLKNFCPEAEHRLAPCSKELKMLFLLQKKNASSKYPSRHVKWGFGETYAKGRNFFAHTKIFPRTVQKIFDQDRKVMKKKKGLS